MSLATDAVVDVPSSVNWRAIWAGAVSAAGLSFTLHAFAAGIGLSVMSAAPTWRESNAFLWTLSGVYLLFVAISAFALGGYITGRLRSAIGVRSREIECNDGLHGLAVWGLAILITATLALGATALTAPAVAPGGGAGAAQSVAGENTIALELDRLFRDSRDNTSISYHRAEAARILLKASSHDGVPQTDREYLIRLVSQITGASADISRERVVDAIAGSRDELRKARIAAVLQAFCIGAALLIGAAVAWLTAVEGGRDREAGTFFAWPNRR